MASGEEALESQDPSMARARIIHGAATVGPVDIYLEGSATPIFTAVAFGTATSYATFSPGAIRLALRPAGAAPDSAPVHTTDVITLAAGDSVSAVAGGLLGSSSPAARFRVQPHFEAFAAPEPGRALVRFVNDSHGLASVGFDLRADGTVEAAGLPSFSSSDAAGISVSRFRSVQLTVESGTPASRLTAFTIPAAVLTREDGVFLTLVGVPTFVPRDPRGVALLAVGPRSSTLILQNPTVFVLPAIPDRAAVDIHAFGLGIGLRLVGEDVGFGALAPALQVPPSSFGVGLFVADAATGHKLSLDATGPLVAGERYLAVTAGFGDTSAVRPQVELTVVREGFDRTTTATGRLRGVAAAPDAPAFDIGQTVPGEETFVPLAGLEALAYRSTSAEAGVLTTPAVPLNPAVRPTGATSASFFRASALTSTDRAFGVVAGAFAPGAADIGPRFIVVKTGANGAWTAQSASPLPQL